MNFFILVLMLMLHCAVACANTHHLDIFYNSPGGVGTILDVHIPEGGVEDGVPTVVFIHGGGWYSGDKSDSPQLWQPLIEEGYGVVSCNYTLSTDDYASYPQAVLDVKAVVRWIRTIGASEWGLSRTIAVTGPSAGGHLTEMLGTTAGIDFSDGTIDTKISDRVQACIPFFGLCDFVMQVKSGGNTIPFHNFLGGFLNAKTLPTYIEASPRTWVTEDDTPMFHVHGDDDQIHLEEQATVMNDELGNVFVYSEVHIYEGGHSFFEIDYGELEGYNAAVAILLEQIPILLSHSRDGDINHDGLVNVSDLLAVIASWGGCPDSPVDCPADINGNGEVDVSDLLAIIDVWS